MDYQAQLKVASSSRKRAELYLNKGKPGRAFSHFLVALKLNPIWKEDLKQKFALTLCTWGRTLESKGRYNDLFACYEQAVDVFGENEDILNNLGAHLFRIGYLNEAAHFFHKALDVSACFLPAHRNLESVYNALVPRWHYCMLNDSFRNEAYREAIFKKIKQGFSTVLDIGTGTGILSLFAVEAGATEVYACDCSDTMINIAHKIMNANNVENKVVLINKMSTDLMIPTDIPHRVSLVVTETLDAGLLGENILQTLTHAWRSLLLPLHHKDEHGLVIPFGADVWVAGIECYHIATKYRLMQDNREVVIDSNEIQNMNCLDFSTIHLVALKDEPYDTQDLKRVPGGFRYLTSVTKAFHINFNDPCDMMDCLSGKAKAKNLAIQCLAMGQLDVWVAWFQLHLDEDIVLSSSPEEGANVASCWDQAVFPLQHPITVIENQEIHITVSCIGGKLSVEVDPASQVKDNKCNFRCGKAEVQKKEADGIDEEVSFQENMSTFKDGVKPCSETLVNTGNEVHKMVVSSDENLAGLTLQQLQTHSVSSSCDTPCLSVSQDVITFLNDKQMMTALNETGYLLRVDQNNTNTCDILDLSPFPVLGLNLLRGSTTRRNHLTCVVKGSNDEEAIRHVANINGIDNTHIQCIKEDVLEDRLDSATPFDFIVVHLIDSSGKLKEKYVNHLPMFKRLLKTKGLILPQWLSVHCQLIHSNLLAEVSRALGKERVCGYKIADYINIYQVSEHQDFSLSSLQHTTCSSVVEALSIACGDLADTVESQLTVEVCVPVTSTGLVNAIPYWFELKFLDSSLPVSTLRMNSYANQTSELVQPEISVECGTNVSVIFKCFQGLFHAELKIDN